MVRPVGSVQLEPNIREISVGYESQSGPTGILLCGCHTWAGLEMNRANRAEGLLGLGSGARTEPSTEQLEMQLTNA